MMKIINCFPCAAQLTLQWETIDRKYLANLYYHFQFYGCWRTFWWQDYGIRDFV